MCMLVIISSQKEKSPTFSAELHYMDGLVSTGNKFPCTILNIIFSIQKNIFNYFFNIFYLFVEKVKFNLHYTTLSVMIIFIFIF